jgi:hypothetical protein
MQRTAGDMLNVYDFTGGATDTPILTVRRSVTSGGRDISSDSPPCCRVAEDFASETLGLNEFGEAGVDMAAADSFTGIACTLSARRRFSIRRRASSISLLTRD